MVSSRGDVPEDVLAAVSVLVVADRGAVPRRARGRGQLHRDRPASAAAARHAGRRRSDREAPSSRDGRQRRGDRCGGRGARRRRRRGRLDRPRATAGERRRLPDRRLQRAVVAGRRGMAARRGRGDGCGVVAGPDDGPHPDRAGAVGTTAPTDAGPSLGRARRLPSSLGGVACLALAGDVSGRATAVHWTNVLLVAGGHGRHRHRRAARQPGRDPGAGGSAPSRLPIAVRLALRDLGRLPGPLRRRPRRDQPRARDPRRDRRHRGRRRAQCGRPATCRIASCSSAPPTSTGRSCPELADVEDLQAGVDRLVASLDDPTVIALDVAVDPDCRTDFPTSTDVRRSRSAERVEDGWSDLSLLYVATPELLDQLRGRPRRDRPRASSILTVETGELGDPRRSPSAGHRSIRPRDGRASAALLPSVVHVAARIVHHARRVSSERGWEAVPSGRWLVETAEPLTERAARDGPRRRRRRRADDRVARPPGRV